MNGIEKIKARIEGDAQAEIDLILNNAKTEADGISDGFKAQAEAEKAELTAKNEAAAAAHEERLISAAQMEAKKITLAAKQEILDEAYALAIDKLCSMPDDTYIETVAALLKKAAPKGVGTVIFSAETRQRIGSKAVSLANEKIGDGKLVLADETRPIKGGFILKNGNIEVNCAFETLVRLQKSETAGAVAKMLFPEI